MMLISPLVDWKKYALCYVDIKRVFNNTFIVIISQDNHVVGTQKNCLTQAILTSTISI